MGGTPHAAGPLQAPEPRPDRPDRPVRPATDAVRAVRRSLRRAAPALALYAAVRLTGMVAMAVWAWRLGRHPLTLLGHSWDAIWYAGIARHGYGTSFPSPDWPGLTFSDLAFFPLLPGLARAVALVTPLGAVGAGLLVAWLASGTAAWGMFAVGDRLHGRRAAFCLVLLWGLLPHAIVQSMAYTEPLLTALAAWSLYAVLTGRWLWAGSLALLAGLCRPNGIAVAAAVCCCAAVAVFGRTETGGAALCRTEAGGTARARTEAGGAALCHTEAGGAAPRWRVCAGAALSPLGWLGYLGWVGARRGDPLGYFAVQADWGSRFDLGRDTLRSVRHVLLGDDVLAVYMVPAVLGAALVSLVLLVLDRPPLALLVYTLVLVAITLGGGGAHYFASKPRFLLPAFPLLLPAALAMARARQRTAVVAAGALAGLSCLYGTYLLTVAPLPM
ncbi:hypothetical protein [Streptomyces sp. XD-27]|uniref:hypothetical protein n=1 Tax=Streptomyces sp. XD-27 TaxID=3062779 RepID=UPI0026F4766C|nr:hypothetical protein [Streptomyces sp. XD-27]WKX71259.1 hypothetical protein Q3Y56_16325 [Streptomyces sp. XD-27]